MKRETDRGTDVSSVVRMLCVIRKGDLSSGGVMADETFACHGESHSTN